MDRGLSRSGSSQLFSIYFAMDYCRYLPTDVLSLTDLEGDLLLSPLYLLPNRAFAGLPPLRYYSYRRSFALPPYLPSSLPTKSLPTSLLPPYLPTPPFEGFLENKLCQGS